MQESKNQAQTSTVTPSFQVPKSYLNYIKFLEFISFKLAAKEILKRFFSPIPFPIPDREKDFLHSAKRNTRKLGEDQYYTLELENDGPKILCMHGWSGRGSQFYALAPFLHSLGYHVFALTGPAHGENPGKQTHMLRFTDAIVDADKEFGPFETLLAHSIGGASVLNAIAAGVKTEKVIIMGTPSNLGQIILDFTNRLKLDDRYVQYLKEYLRNAYGDDYDKFSPSERVKSMGHLPGLIIHDTQDLDVDLEQARENHAHWPNSELYISEGLGHRRILSDERIFEKIRAFLKGK